MQMKAMRLTSLCVVVLLVLLTMPCYARNPLTTLHNFRGGIHDGQSPNAKLILSGSTLYGTAWFGGGTGCDGYGCGTIFSVNTSGSNYRVLHSFGGGENDGDHPYGDLILSGSTVYGMTRYSGAGCSGSDCGTIFSVNTDGSNYKLLHTFTGGVGDGGYPGRLIVSGSTLFGTSIGGGSTGCDSGAGCGTIFSMNTDGSSYRLLHIFTAEVNDGAYPGSSLILSGSTLYGITRNGGGTGCGGLGCGTIFSIGTEGSDIKLLYSFAGEYPSAGGTSLILSGSTLYGFTAAGGETGYGTIFSIENDGSNHRVLHSFTGGTNDGTFPGGSLILSGSVLYGATVYGGGSNCGTIFSINTDGNDYKLLYSFTSGDCGGVVAPLGPASLVLTGSTLYGMNNEDDGTIFSMHADGTNYTRLHSFTGKMMAPSKDIILSGSRFYGTTAYGGGTDCGGMGCGTVFSFSPITLKVAKSGTGEGVVASSPSGIDCGTNCSWSFARETEVTLTATPDVGSTFTGWTGGGCIGRGPCRVKMNNNVNVMAAFVTKRLTVHASAPGGHGRVSPASRKVSYGGSASIVITPNKGYRVATITDNGQSVPVSNPYVIEDVTADHNVVVAFAPDK